MNIFFTKIYWEKQNIVLHSYCSFMHLFFIYTKVLNKNKIFNIFI